MIRLEQEATRKTQSKHSYSHDAAGGNRANFRVAVRFFDEYKIEHLPLFSREVADERPARQCCVSKEKQIESRTDATFTGNRHP